LLFHSGNGCVIFNKRCERIGMLLVRSGMRFSDSLQRIPVRYDDPAERDRSGYYQCYDSSVVALFFAALIFCGLGVASVLTLTYTGNRFGDASDALYYSGISIGFVLMLLCVLMLSSILGLFPNTPLPHLCLF
jgi:hypothetical protein